MNKNEELHKLWVASQSNDPDVLAAAQYAYNMRKQKALSKHKRELLDVPKPKPKKRKRK